MEAIGSHGSNFPGVMEAIVLEDGRRFPSTAKWF